MESNTTLHIKMPNVLLNGSYRDPITGKQTKEGEPLEVRWDFLMEDLAECLPDQSIAAGRWNGKGSESYLLAEANDLIVEAQFADGLLLHITGPIEFIERYLCEISNRLEVKLSPPKHVYH